MKRKGLLYIRQFVSHVDMKKTAVIILNWNGWRDTCECIASVRLNHNSDFQLILIDNGSEDDSLIQIKKFLLGQIYANTGPVQAGNKCYYSGSSKCLSVDTFENSRSLYEEDLLLISSAVNMGFARACNVGITYSIKAGYEYTFLLNNDTTVNPGCIGALIQFLENHPDYHIASPIIYYYHNPEKIWYFGGKLTFTGRRLIYNENKDRQSLKNSTKEMTFISGCALFAQTEVFNRYGLLAERFFFGEEDYEFSWRMKENGIRMCAISDAVVYHKVSISNKRLFSEDRLPYMFIGYLNRFIDRKIHTRSRFKYNIWRMVCCFYIFPKLIFINRYPIIKISKMFRLLIKFSSQYNCIDKKLFYEAKTLFKI